MDFEVKFPYRIGGAPSDYVNIVKMKAQQFPQYVLNLTTDNTHAA